MPTRPVIGAVALVAVVVFVGGVTVGALVVADDAGGDEGSGSATDGTTATAESPRAEPAPPVSMAPAPPMEDVPQGDPERGTRQGSPLDELPEGVTVLTDFGQRPDWSPDGSAIVFLDDSPLGDVWTVDVGTGTTRQLTDRFEHRGFSRAAYLANGDLLLCGPTSGPAPTSERPEAGRFTGVLSVLRAPFDEPPQPLGIPCWEGIATARTSMRIAWNRSDIDYTDSDLVDRVVNGITEVWTGEIRDIDGRATVVDAHKVLDRDAFGSLAVFEVQAFRPPDENELLLTAYAYQGGEVIGLDARHRGRPQLLQQQRLRGSRRHRPRRRRDLRRAGHRLRGGGPRCAGRLAARPTGPERPVVGARHVLQPLRPLLRIEPQRRPRRTDPRVPALHQR